MSELREIHKYAIDLATMGAQHPIPEGSFFLDLQVQNGVPVMWWSVPHGEYVTELRTFAVAITGSPGYTANLHYVGTFQLADPELERGEVFVGHVLSREPIPRATELQNSPAPKPERKEANG